MRGTSTNKKARMRKVCNVKRSSLHDLNIDDESLIDILVDNDRYIVMKRLKMRNSRRSKLTVPEGFAKVKINCPRGVCDGKINCPRGVCEGQR